MAFRSYRHVGLLLLLVFPLCFLEGQEDTSLVASETLLRQSYQNILEQNEYKRENVSFNFFHQFAEALSQNGSYDYPFDSLKYIGKIYSPDHNIRFYSWNIPVGIDGNLYFGFAQYFSKTDKNFRVVPLYSGAVSHSADSLNWYGALYYEIVETKHAGQKYYTLLGYDLNNALSNKKVIEIIAIDQFDELYFPKKLFQEENKMQDRMVFEYNEQAQMMLRYDKQQKMIVFDHLSPDRPSQEGQYQFYGPDFSYDGLKWEKGVWVLYKNISVTN